MDSRETVQNRHAGHLSVGGDRRALIVSGLQRFLLRGSSLPCCERQTMVLAATQQSYSVI